MNFEINTFYFIQICFMFGLNKKRIQLFIKSIEIIFGKTH